MINVLINTTRSISSFFRQHFIMTVVSFFLVLLPALSQPHYKIIDSKKLNEAVTRVNRIVRENYLFNRLYTECSGASLA